MVKGIGYAVKPVQQKLNKKIDNNYRFFLDLTLKGMYGGANGVHDLLNTLVSLNPYSHRIVLSVASSVQLPGATGDAFCLYRFLTNFKTVNLTTGFTNDEASQFVAMRKYNLMFEQVKYTSGNNPCLLSLLPNNKTTVDYYQGIVKANVMQLLQHIQGLVKGEHS